ncbi:DUF4861 family protein [Hallella colorans]|uniref:DUF4861 family protein n=1 Tax=Hallella colorans TaxID=1703337 RepID=UPI0023F0D8F8|nr:DUF4861 family protein [Hallella colorans]
MGTLCSVWSIGLGLGAMCGWDGLLTTMLVNVVYRTQRTMAHGPVKAIVEVKEMLT